MRRTSRNLKLSPMQREVLWMLEEAGEENVPALLNTLQALFPDKPYQSLLAEVQAAIRGLWQLQLVAFSRDHGKPNLHYVLLDEAESRHALLLIEEVEYETTSGGWTRRPGAGAYPLGLVLTDSGRTALTS